MRAMVLRKTIDKQKKSKGKSIDKKVSPNKKLPVSIEVKKKRGISINKDASKNNKKTAKNNEGKRQYWMPTPEALLQQLQEAAKKPFTEKIKQETKVQESKDNKRKKIHSHERKKSKKMRTSKKK